MLPLPLCAAADPVVELRAIGAAGRVVGAPIINPYLKTMGIQSQVRCGSGKASKRQATKAKIRKLHQTAIPGGNIFIPMQHCKICKAEWLKMKGHNVNTPHRPHHP